MRPEIDIRYRLYLDIISSIFLIYIWYTNTGYFHGTRLSFSTGFNRYFPGSTAAYCFLFLIFSVKIRLPFLFAIAVYMGFLTQSRNFALSLFVVIICYLILPLIKDKLRNTSKLIFVYVIFGGLIFWILEMISTGQLSGTSLFGERIFKFTAEPVRLSWELLGLNEWAKSMQSLIWGYGNWDDIGPNPHHSLTQTLLERGLITTTVLLIIIMKEVARNIKGIEPWIIGFFSLSYFFPMSLISVYWLIFLLILKCNLVQDNVYRNEDYLVEKIVLLNKILFKK